MQEACRCRVVAPFALYGFHQQGGDVLRRHFVLEEQCQLVEGTFGGVFLAHAPPVGMGEGGHEHGAQHRVVAVPVLGVGGGVGDGAHGAAVKATAEGDHRLPSRGVFGELHRRFDGFGSRIGEAEALNARRGDLPQLLGDPEHRLVAEHAAGVGQAGELLAGGGDHFRMVVAQVGDRGPAREVGPPVPGGVVHPEPLCPLDEQIGVEPEHRGDEIFMLHFGPFGRCGGQAGRGPAKDRRRGHAGQGVAGNASNRSPST